MVAVGDPQKAAILLERLRSFEAEAEAALAAAQRLLGIPPLLALLAGLVLKPGQKVAPTLEEQNAFARLQLALKAAGGGAGECGGGLLRLTPALSPSPEMAALAAAVLGADVGRAEEQRPQEQQEKEEREEEEEQEEERKRKEERRRAAEIELLSLVAREEAEEEERARRHGKAGAKQRTAGSAAGQRRRRRGSEQREAGEGRGEEEEEEGRAVPAPADGGAGASLEELMLAPSVDATESELQVLRRERGERREERGERGGHAHDVNDFVDDFGFFFRIQYVSVLSLSRPLSIRNVLHDLTLISHSDSLGAVRLWGEAGACAGWTVVTLTLNMMRQ